MPPVLGRLSAADLGLPGSAGLGTTASLLQLSSGFCAPCRAARHVLEHVADESPGVRHLDLDVAHHPSLAARLSVHTTPTVLLLDADGSIRARYERVPRLAELRAQLARLTHRGGAGDGVA